MIRMAGTNIDVKLCMAFFVNSLVVPLYDKSGLDKFFTIPLLCCTKLMSTKHAFFLYKKQ